MMRDGLIAVVFLFSCSVAFAQGGQVSPTEPVDPETPRHYAPNGNFATGNYATGPGASGFDIADVSSKAVLDGLPDGTTGLVFLGTCNGSGDPNFQNAVLQYRVSGVTDPKLFGFYLMDDPNPTSCLPSNLQSETQYIHSNLGKGIVTFIALQNLGTFANPSYCTSTPCTAANTYNNANTNVDYFGVAPYLCRSELNSGQGGCDYSAIQRFYNAAIAAGITGPGQIVPIYQTFGCVPPGTGCYHDDAGGYYLMPTITQLGEILQTWGEVYQNPSGNPDWDFAYSWGTQNNDIAISSSTDTQTFFLWRNSSSTLR